MWVPEQLRERRHSRLLETTYPGVTAAASAARTELADAHNRYTTQVSRQRHAASLELSAFLLGFCRTTKPARVLDLGSGFSSYVLRLYGKEEEGAAIASVDTDETWLARKQEFCADMSMPGGTFSLWSEFGRGFPDGSGYELVLHDLGDMAIRVATLSQALLLTSHPGNLILDDVHKPGYGAHARRIVSASALWYLNLRQLTLDKSGRYSLLVHRFI
jgi:hypothetical protein